MTLKHPIAFILFLLATLSINAQEYGNIEFIENKGKWDNKVKFKGNVSGGAFFIRSAGITVLQHNKEDLNTIYSVLHQHSKKGSQKKNEDITLRSHAYNVDFLDASPNHQIIPDKLIPTYNNYFIGNDSSKWAGNCQIGRASCRERV